MRHISNSDLHLIGGGCPTNQELNEAIIVGSGIISAVCFSIVGIAKGGQLTNANNPYGILLGAGVGFTFGLLLIPAVVKFEEGVKALYQATGVLPGPQAS